MLPARGRPGLTLLMSVSREITPLDLLRLSSEDTPRVAAPVLQRLRASHHAAARHLASGKSIKETAILVGRTAQRIGDLTRDPTFQELIHYYTEQKAEIAINDTNRIQAKLVEITDIATDELLDRLEDDDTRKKIPIGEVRQILTAAGDRSVAPAKTAQPIITTPTNITFNMGTKDIRPKIIDGEATKLNPSTPSLPASNVDKDDD